MLPGLRINERAINDNNEMESEVLINHLEINPQGDKVMVKFVKLERLKSVFIYYPLTSLST